MGQVRDFRTVDGENLMCQIEAANKMKTDDLAHGTNTHIKVTLSAMSRLPNVRASTTALTP